ncbi:hypothetical protein K438DRAFT_1830675 [Mycena galopus ATCC 62051]|nr:hypothetical protein K438DRAFT_1830675 [Mycena galopus ATCC 62051]
MPLHVHSAIVVFVVSAASPARPSPCYLLHLKSSARSCITRCNFETRSVGACTRCAGDGMIRAASRWTIIRFFIKYACIWNKFGFIFMIHNVGPEISF